ncbi:MAG TPA: glycosyl hydrolase [Acidobacteriota bacterium]|nr:glycosyl hydrolase [Acidobacteriota bacterium]
MLRHSEWILRLVLALLLCGLPVLAAPLAENSDEAAEPRFDPKLFSALEYRLIGPYRGGRVTAVEGVPDEPHTFYMGSTGGGVWETRDAGQSWRNITDGHIGVGSIGAIAVAPSDRNVIYLGTGSSQPRGNISNGDGMYKSLDAGKTWTHVGLPKAGLISRIRVHPKDPDLVYAAVMGNIFGPNPERGVYRSSDGGANWEKVLYIDDKTGCVDLSMDASNPRVLYAGLWRVERKPWTLIDGAEEGGLYKSVDGGETWNKLTKDLPGGILGRIGVSVSPADPQRVWVIQEVAEVGKGGVFRSDDGGKSFARVNRERRLLQRHWYYSRIYADPQDENTVYVVNTGFYKSVDGGKTFERIRTPHGDNHDLWINPRDTRIMIESNDGGANVSLNGGQSWSSQYNQPTAEMYRVTVDNQFPYRVYACQQDNSSISVPSWSPGGIDPKQHWEEVGGGESGHIAVDPRDPDMVYAGNYIGQIDRYDMEAGHRRDIVAYPQLHDGVAGRDIRYRFQWNAPIRLSPHDPDVLYHCSQYVHRSTDGGQSWEVISPDLTTDNDDYQDIPGGPVQHDHTGVELYTTIFAFEESPHQAGVLWAGSDDGLVHISQDNGGNWQNVTPPDMPAGGTVNTIELSPHGPGRAFLAVYRYREADFTPYIFRTDDYGASWELISQDRGIPDDHFVRVVREDPKRKGLLYAGTEYGMYVSFDDGASWQEFQLNLPRTPITDLAVHRDDLVVATQGRSFWILDDLTPLHELSDEIASKDFHLYAPRAAYRTQMRGFRGGGASPEPPPRGALIRYYLTGSGSEDMDDDQGPGQDSEGGQVQEAESGEGSAPGVRMEILDAEGNLIRTFAPKPGEGGSRSPAGPDPEDPEAVLDVSPGMHDFVWDLRYKPPHLAEGAVLSLSFTGGPSAPPGAYQVRLTVDGQEQTRSFRIEKDPRWTVSDDDLQEQFRLTLEIRDLLTSAHDPVRTLRSLREQAKAVAKRASEAGKDEEIKEAADQLAEKLTAVEEELFQTKHESGQDPINFPSRIDNQIAYLYSVVNGQDARPTEGAYQRLEDLRAQLGPIKQELEEIIQSDLEAFNRLLQEKGAQGVMLPQQ